MDSEGLIVFSLEQYVSKSRGPVLAAPLRQVHSECMNVVTLYTQLVIRISICALLCGSIGCSTLGEMTSSTDSSAGYTKTKNAAGETVYRRTEPARVAYSPPVDRYEPIHPIALHSSTDSTTSSTARTTTPSPTLSSNFFGSLEAASTEGHLHLGGHLGYSVNPYFEPRIGLSFFGSKDFYAGADLSARANLPLGALKLFTGIGGYVGDTKKCATAFNPYNGRLEETCEKKFLTTGYVEAGVEVGSFSVFVRDYNIERAGLNIPTPLFYGIGLRL